MAKAAEGGATEEALMIMAAEDAAAREKGGGVRGGRRRLHGRVRGRRAGGCLPLRRPGAHTTLSSAALAGKAGVKVSLGLVPRSLDTPKDLWGKTILMRRADAKTLVISQIYVYGVIKQQIALTTYSWAGARKSAMQDLIVTTGEWPNIVGERETSELTFSCARAECAADDGVEDMSACECRACKDERATDSNAGVWLHKSCAADEWAAGDGGSDFVGDVGDDFVCKQCRDEDRNEPAGGT